jgi:hypothetical protein
MQSNTMSQVMRYKASNECRVYGALTEVTGVRCTDTIQSPKTHTMPCCNASKAHNDGQNGKANLFLARLHKLNRALILFQVKLDRMVTISQVHDLERRISLSTLRTFEFTSSYFSAHRHKQTPDIRTLNSTKSERHPINRCDASMIMTRHLVGGRFGYIQIFWF